MNENIHADSTPKSNRARRVLRWSLITLAWLATLAVLFYAVENWRGARAAQTLKREFAVTGTTLGSSALIPPPVPDDQNFAMTPFFAPLYDFQPGTQTPRDEAASTRVKNFARDFKPDKFRRGPGNGGWQLGRKVELTDPAAILEALQPYTPDLDELRAASLRPHARFNIRYEEDNPWAILIPHLAVVKTLCQILSVRASTELALGQTEPALQDIHLALHLADSVKSEPVLISQLVRVAGVQIVLQPIWEGLAERRWSDAQLAALQTRLSQFDLIASFQFAFDAERVWGNATIDRVRDRRIHLRTLFAEGPESQELTGWQAEAVAALQAGPRGWFDQEKLNYNRLYHDVLLPAFNADARRFAPKVVAEKQQELEQTLAGATSVIASHRVMAKLLLPALGKACHKFASAQTFLDEATLACALERHRLANGQFPDRLDALPPRFIAKLPHDLITGELLKYRRTEDGRFALYSVGWNETDDGGTVATASDQGSRPDLHQGDWVWAYRAK